jgi:hypothetical protein
MRNACLRNAKQIYNRREQVAKIAQRIFHKNEDRVPEFKNERCRSTAVVPSLDPEDLPYRRFRQPKSTGTPSNTYRVPLAAQQFDFVNAMFSEDVSSTQ